MPAGWREWRASVVLLRIILIAFVTAVLIPGGIPPDEWVPIRWDGGPLEVLRRAESENPILTDAQREAVRDWYRPDRLELLAGSPYNCLLLSWSLGRATDADAEQRKLVSEQAALARERGLAVLASVAFGPEWLESVQAAADVFDGIVLEGEFPLDAAKQALAGLQQTNPEAVVIPMGGWREVRRDGSFPILGSLGGLWPGMLSVSEAEEWGAGPTGNPWVLSNAWQVGALLADGSGRPAWMGHRPKRHRPQPLEFADHARSVADTGMAGGKWVVALGDDWRERLFKREDEALAEWKRLGEHVKFFAEREDWRNFQAWPSVVVVHDPVADSQFDSFDVLNMLSVYHVPHRVVLRSDLAEQPLEPGTAVMVFDFAPGAEPELNRLREFTGAGGALLLGPSWRTGEEKAGASAPELIAGAGSISKYPAEEVDSDRFSRQVRDLVEDKHVAPRPYNVGSIISLYRYDSSSGQALLQMTEYGDYPTENITVRFPREVASAKVYFIDREPIDLKIYEGDKGGSEIDIPEVPGYCAVIIEFR